MFSKPSTFLVSAVVLALSLQVNAHCEITPALGTGATPARKDVQRPSAAKPCGNVAISTQALDTATPVVADAQGNMVVTATSFNGGTDGGRQVTLQVDPTGTGKSFQAVTIATNGVANPPGPGSQQITFNMGAIKCTGGTAGNLCLMAFKTNGGFGNCAVGQTGGAAAGAAAAKTAAPAAGAAVGGTAAGGKAGGKKGGAAANTTAGTSAAARQQAAMDKNTQPLIPDTDTVAARSDRRAVGSRAARAYLMALE